MAAQRMIEHRHRIHPATQQHADFHGGGAADSGKVASVVSWIPPRGANSPRTINSRGFMMRDQVVEDAVDDFLIERRLVAIGGEIKLEALGFHTGSPGT